jgi:hypothetical protein
MKKLLVAVALAFSLGACNVAEPASNTGVNDDHSWSRAQCAISVDGLRTYGSLKSEEVPAYFAKCMRRNTTKALDMTEQERIEWITGYREMTEQQRVELKQQWMMYEKKK